VYFLRFGNIYAEQLLQLLKKLLMLGRRPDSGERVTLILLIPFRPNIEPQGFDTADDLFLHAIHLQAVREMFLNTDVFITFHIRGSRAG
jgi:hypothetical protein